MAGYPNQFLVDKGNDANTALDYAFLRSKGIELIQQYAGQLWTDFNLHDPGVTILEHLCYAITDLAYRAGFPVTELLADENGNIDRTANAFFSGKHILSTAPVNARDYRKLILDAFPDISNVWIKPVTPVFATGIISGQYSVTIQIRHTAISENEPDTDVAIQNEKVIEEVRSLLLSLRNMAEDFSEFTVLKPQPVAVNAQIIIGNNAVPEEVLANIYYLIEKTLAPPVVFFTEKELLSKGYRVEDIYSGPLLQHGILPDESLSDRIVEIDPSWLSQAVSQIGQVIHINHFEMVSEGEVYNTQPLTLKPDHYPVLVFNASSPGIKLYSGNLPLPLKNNVFISLLQRWRDNLKKRLAGTDHHLEDTPLKGTYTDLKKYTSIQNLFPALYRIGAEGIEEKESPARKAKAKQLKAYLMFFEQILAGSLAQLGQLNQLFSPHIHLNAATYFSHPLFQVPGADSIIKAFTASGTDWPSFVNNPANEYVKALQQITENKEDFRRRKKRLFEHLLSRFNVIPDAYPVRLFESCYRTNTAESNSSEELKWMSELLQNILPFNNFRNKAHNYSVAYPTSESASGFAYNMRLLLYIPNKANQYTIQTLGKYLKYLSKNEQKGSEEQGSGEGSSIRTVQLENEELQVDTDGYKDGKNQQFQFRRQSDRLLTDGTDRKNFRIIPGWDGADAWLILYKAPEEKGWQVTGIFQSRQDAVTALRLFIEKLRKMSMDSEGFHIAEHLLLAPSGSEKAHGFQFFDHNGNLLLEQAALLSFSEREAVIARIKQVANAAEPAKLQDCLTQLQDVCNIAVTQNGTTVLQEPDQLTQMPAEELSWLLRMLVDNINACNKDQTRFYPHFRFFIQQQNDESLDEEFFDSQVTVVFPAWPKRFQDTGFRAFAEKTFSNQLPVHIKPNFLWLAFVKMKQFEDLHATWAATMQTKDEPARQSAAAALRHFLIAENNVG